MHKFSGRRKSQADYTLIIAGGKLDIGKILSKIAPIGVGQRANKLKDLHRFSATLGLQLN